MAMMPARDNALPGPIPLKAINSGAGMLESALGRRLFPIRCESIRAMYDKVQSRQSSSI